VLEERAEALLARAEQLGNSAALGDVGQIALDVLGIPLIVLHNHCVIAHPEDAAVLVP
jgi:hypothetical protein